MLQNITKVPNATHPQASEWQWGTFGATGILQL